MSLLLSEKRLRFGTTLLVLAVFFFTGAKLQAQMTDIPRLQNIMIVEDGVTYPTVANQNGTVQITPGRLLKERNLQTLTQLLETYIGWPADASSVEAIGRAVASWGKGNAVYFNLLAPISIPPDLTLTLYPKAEGPSFLTYVQPKINYTEAGAYAPSPSYWVDMANSETAQINAGRADRLEGERNKIAAAQSRLIEEKCRLESENGRLAEEKSKLREIIIKLSNRLKEVKAQKEDDVTTAEYVKDAEEKNEKLQTVVSQLAQRLKQAESASSQVQHVKAEKEKLQSIVDGLGSKLQESKASKARIQKLEAEKDQLKAMLMNLAKMVKRSQVSREKVQKLEASKAQMRELVESLTRELKSARHSKEKLVKIENEKNRLQDILKKLSAELQKVKSERNNEELSVEKDELKAKLEILARKLRESQNSQVRVRQLEEEKIKLQQTLEQMSQELKESRTTRARVAQLEAEKRQLQDALRELSRELDEARGLQSRIQQVEVEKNKLHATLEGLSREFDDAQTTQNKIREIETDRNRLDGELQAISGELDDARLRAQEDEIGQRVKVQDIKKAQKERRFAESEKVKVQTMQEDEGDVEDLPELKPVMRKETEKLGARSRIIQKVVIAAQGQRDMGGEDEGEGIIVRMAQLPEEAIEQIKRSAQILLNKPLSMEMVRQVGIEIGRSLKAYGLNHYDVVLPQQNIKNGTIGIEIRTK